MIGGSGDGNLLATYREGKFHYRIPVENGRYRVTLSFVEPKSGGQRQFDVLANGRRMLSRFDILTSAGAPMTKVERSFEIQVGSAMLDLDFVPLKGEAIVSEVQVVAQ